ncbi:N-acetyltransferase [Amycolatopsis rhizosphaerae]|uniref:N-acetyltransferase n=1 Tax=Amycolatopsis rhizosphaerae TaxID=2053003 RepID=A0A558DEC5_9PSEU|nr:GNAT family N-acetyltransferase [Amycolatopsis rhizosphaerae]TVT59369.1 N-acetyltransferase [Amycolatopsis rhizosphaerae]
MAWTVRAAVAADADRIAEINVDAWRHAYRGLIAESVLAAMDTGARAVRWAEIVRDLTGPAALFVAVGPDARIGAYAGVTRARDEGDRFPGLRTGELTALYADPAGWGRGAGSAVHRAALDHLVAHGFEHAVLWVLAGNERARRFYEERGWRPDEVVKDAGIGDRPAPKIRYSRPLRASE